MYDGPVYDSPVYGGAGNNGIGCDSYMLWKMRKEQYVGNRSLTQGAFLPS